MKDKRLYLKIASLLEAIYIIVMAVYYLFFTKLGSKEITNLFLLIISIIFLINFYKESKKDINFLKNNNIKIKVASIWFLFDFLIPGILGFVFLSKIKEKKEIKLPVIKEKERNIKEIILSVSGLLFFSIVMFILPRFSIFSKMNSYIMYLVILVGVIILYNNDLINDLKIYIKNIKVYFPFIIKRYLKMLGLMLVVAVPISLLNNGMTSNNQQAINAMFEKLPLATLLLSCFYAPLVEETIFRLSLSKLFNNKKIFIIVSGLIFGFLHVMNNFPSYPESLYIFQYSALGVCLAKAYKDTNNIFVSISMHFIQNFLAAILVLLLF